MQVWAFLRTLPGCPALAVQAVGNTPFSLNSSPPLSTRIQVISGFAKPGGGGRGLGPEPQFLQVSAYLDEQRAGSLVASPSGATLKKHHKKKKKQAPQTGWLQETEMCPLPVLKAASPQSRCQQGYCPRSHSWLSGKELRTHGFHSWVRKICWRRKWQIHSSTLGWRIPGTGEPGRLQSMGLQRVKHDSTTKSSPKTWGGQSFLTSSSFRCCQHPWLVATSVQPLPLSPRGLPSVGASPLFS